MRTDLFRRKMVKGFACVGAGAFLPPCCLPAIAAGRDFVLKDIGDGIYAFSGLNELMTEANQGAICNLGVIVGKEAVAVVDSGGSLIEAEAFIATIREVTDRPIKYLISTHMHPDHIFGNAAFRDIGATIVGHHNLPRALEARGAFYLQSYRNQIGDGLMKGIEIVPPTVVVTDPMTLDLGGRSIELRAWKPAHTDNDLTVFDTATKTFFTGDLVFRGHLPTLDGSFLGWIDQMGTLSDVKAARAIPGHGPVPSDWPDALVPELRYFQALAMDLRDAIAKGTPLSEAVKTAGLSEKDNWSLFDDYNERNATTAYAELEWE
ncbi:MULTISPECIES: quinoprotein relay system zinc metallohydrolase 2 [unclassified Mesorhizobium]|uniref:quinoprotein relay system zinc metallohydrolase 2 n=1 Tax=unclassified Mesorhizobium TaxID=325217 RepID=UPI00301462D5